MNEQEKQEFEALQCEVIRLRIWIETIFKHSSNLGITKIPSLSNDAVLKGANPFEVDIQLKQLVQQGNVNAAADRFSDLTGANFGEAKASVKQVLK